MESLRNLFKNRERDLHIKQYEKYVNFAKEREALVSQYEHRWRLFHKSLGLTATAASALCIVFTLSSQQIIVLLLSATSSVSAASMTFLNSAQKELKWISVKGHCSILRLEIEDKRTAIYSQNTSSSHRIEVLRILNQKLKEFERCFHDAPGSGK